MKDPISAITRYVGASIVLVAILCSIGLPHHHHESTICLLIQEQLANEPDARSASHSREHDKESDQDSCISKKAFFQTSSRSKQSHGRTISLLHDAELCAPLILLSPFRQEKILLEQVLCAKGVTAPSSLRGRRAPPFPFL